MSVLTLALAGALATIFAISGVSKLISASSTATALSALNLPTLLSKPGMVRAFAAAELLLALALLASWGWVLGIAAFASVGAAAMFVAIAIGALRLPEPVDCGCFGDLVESKTGAGMLTRNVVILAAAIALACSILMGGDAGPLPALINAGEDLVNRSLATTSSVLGAGIFVLAPRLRRSTRHDEVRQPQGIPSYAGQLTAIPDGLTPGTTLLLRPGCSGCDAVIARLESLIRAYPDADIGASILIDATPEWIAEHHPDLAERSEYGIGELQHTLSIPGLPAAVLLEHDGRFMRRIGTKAVLDLLPHGAG